MKRCPACGTVYSVAQGFCPMDGAPLAEDAAPATSGAWDPPRAPATTSEVFIVPPQSRAVSAGGSGSFLATAATGVGSGPGVTAGGFGPPPQARPIGPGAVAAVAAPGPAHDPANTGTALIPPLTPPGALRSAGPARTVVAMVPPSARSPGANFLSAMDAPRADVRGDMSSGTGPATSFGAASSSAATSSGAHGLAQVPASAAVQADGAFFPPGGLSRPRVEAPAPNSWEESLVGRVLDQRYRIEGCIGAGGMGVVYKATHVIIDKPLAIKMLRAEVASQPDIVKRFLLEAQLASKVKHPNVVDISDYGQIAGQTAYYVMEYLAGETLAHRIDTGGRVDPTQAIDIAIQTAQALQAAHANKIIHRDLKSENIFLCQRPDGGVQAKILDFGIARIRDKKTRLTAMGALIGTPAYMSPEQAQGAEVDERSDLYALGVILFEMLSGRVPFKAPTVAMVLSAQIFDAPPSLHEIEAGVPDLPNIEHVLHRLLAKNRDERPRDAAEVIHLLKTSAEVDLQPSQQIGPGSSLSGIGGLGGKRRPTVTIGSWSVAENPSGLHRSDANPSVAGEARGRPETDAMTPRTVSASGRIQRRPSVIVPSGTPVERIAAPPARPVTGEMEARHFPTGVNQTVRAAGPPMILIIAAAASIGAAITVTLYKVWRRNQAPVAVQAPPQMMPVAMTRLTFESDPPGAVVATETGERWGVTPFTREVSAASPRTRVVFRLAGHDDAPLEVSAAESVVHRIHLRPQAPAPTPAVDVAPAPIGTTASGDLGAATAGDPPEQPSEAVSSTPAPAKAAIGAPTGTSSGTKTPKSAKTRPEPPAKADAPAKAEAPPAPAPVEDELDMGELKNPFRKK